MLPRQKEVFDACKKYKCTLYSGAFRAGKTILLGNVALSTCLDHPGSVGLMGALVDSQARDVVLGTFVSEADKYQKALDDYLHPRGMHYQILKQIVRTQGKMEVRFSNGSKIFIKSCEDHRKLAGRTLDFFCLDEAIDMEESIFTELLGRISGTGNLKQTFGLVCTNPGAETHWLHKHFYDEKPANFYTVETTTYDNVLLPDYQAYIRDLERVYDPDWITRFLDGRWGAFSGQIFKDFNLERHTGLYNKGNMKFVKYLAGVDYGIRSPSCILTAGISEYDKMYVVDEYYTANTTSRELAKKLSELHAEYDYEKVYIDPSAADVVTQAYRLGVPCGKMKGETPVSFANNDVAESISKIKSFLINNRLFIDKTCLHTVRQMQAYRYKKDTEQPVKVDDHSVDALRYAVTDFDPFSERASFGVVYWGNKR